MDGWMSHKKGRLFPADIKGKLTQNTEGLLFQPRVLLGKRKVLIRKIQEPQKKLQKRLRV